MRLVPLALSFLLLLPALSTAAPDPIFSDEFYVQVEPGVDIAVHHKTRGHGASKVPVLLVHGTSTNAGLWDFPGRSVMDYLAKRGYDVYALDLRGMGDSTFAGSYWDIGIANRLQDVLGVAYHLLVTTGQKPVVIGWSQGAILTALVAANAPDLVAGIGLFSLPATGFTTPPELVPIFYELIASGVDRWLAPPEIVFRFTFGFDPVTGDATIDAGTFGLYYARSEPESMQVLLEEFSPDFFADVMGPAFHAISVPTLVVDGAVDFLVGAPQATALYEMLTTTDKSLVILPRNAHGFFIEDNFHATMRVFNDFLDRF